MIMISPPFREGDKNTGSSYIEGAPSNFKG